MFAHQATVNALLAGSLIALASGPIGWFAVLRAQVFAGDTLSHVAFAGALIAAAAAIDLRIGLFVATALAALAIAAAGGRRGADDVTIGIVLTGVLGIGVLFIYLGNSGAVAGGGTIAVRALFGSLDSLGSSEALLAALVAAAILAGMLTIARPLLFATLQRELALAQGLPVALLGGGFLLLLGADAAEATQALGALLMLGLIAAPAGIAHRITSVPYAGMALASVVALAGVWIGVSLSYLFPALPPASAIVLVIALAYTATFAR